MRLCFLLALAFSFVRPFFSPSLFTFFLHVLSWNYKTLVNITVLMYHDLTIRITGRNAHAARLPP
jgi:hypothetical protein